MVESNVVATCAVTIRSPIRSKNHNPTTAFLTEPKSTTKVVRSTEHLLGKPKYVMHSMCWRAMAAIVRVIAF